MAPKLYLDPLSGACRSVWMTCEALGLNIETVHLDLMKGEQNAEWFLKINPRHCVPAFDDGEDGFLMLESRSIMRYLAAKHDSDTLYPKDIKKRYLVDMALDTEMSFIYKAVGAFFYPKLLRNEEANEEAIKGVDTILTFINDVLMKSTKFVAGDNMTIADFAVFTSLQMLLIGGFKFEDFSKYKKVGDFVNHFKSLPYYEKCNAGFEKIVGSYTAKI